MGFFTNFWVAYVIFYQFTKLLRFRNVLSAASRLQTLVVRNICSDAMLKLIGAHCNSLQYLVVANSKQVSKSSVSGVDINSSQSSLTFIKLVCTFTR